MIHAITGSSSCSNSVAGVISMTRASYTTLSAANHYFQGRIDNDVWFDTGSDKQTRSLITATRYIDCLNFSGNKTDSDQVLEFPRNGGTTIPDDIKFACYEVAYNLLDGRDPEFESEHAHVGMSNIATVRTTKDTESVPVHILHNIPSSLAWAYLRPYLLDANTLQIQRTN